MPMELSHLIQLVCGQKSSLPVGDLPQDVAKYLGCHPGIVYLGHKEVLKIVRKHREIRVEELQCLPFAIALPASPASQSHLAPATDIETQSLRFLLLSCARSALSLSRRKRGKLDDARDRHSRLRSAIVTSAR